MAALLSLLASVSAARSPNRGTTNWRNSITHTDFLAALLLLCYTKSRRNVVLPMSVRGRTSSTIFASLLKKGAFGGRGRRISTPVKEQRSVYFCPKSPTIPTASRSSGTLQQDSPPSRKRRSSKDATVRIKETDSGLTLRSSAKTSPSTPRIFIAARKSRSSLSASLAE